MHMAFSAPAPLHFRKDANVLKLFARFLPLYERTGAFPLRDAAVSPTDKDRAC